MASGILEFFKRCDSQNTGLIARSRLKGLLQALDSERWTDDVCDGFLNDFSTAESVRYEDFVNYCWGADPGQARSMPMTESYYGQARMGVAAMQLCGMAPPDDAATVVAPKCKIICTMGPSCWDVDMLLKLIDAGLNICRLNFSHGDHEGHASCVKRIREAAAQRPGQNIGILLDTKGPEIRTGFFREDVGGKINLEKGQDLKLVVDYSFKGDSTCIAVSYKQLCQSVKPGGTILCADGSLSLRVKSVAADHVVTEVLNSVSIGERKNCNLPGVKVELPVLQEKDINDLQNFGIPQDVDFVAASFVQSGADVRFIREVLGEAGKHIKIISKIENEEGLKKFDEILDESDGIMVARGDLGMEIPPEKVFLAQKMMIGKCNVKGKPVITATQMLESMTSMPRPTRAEAGDVANAVLDGTDCVMLSGETAGGQFPLNAVTIMRSICSEAEKALDYNSLNLQTRLRVLAEIGGMSKTEAMSSAAVKNAIDAGIRLIVAVSATGHTARQIAKYRPGAPVIAVVSNARVARSLALNRGLVPTFANPVMVTSDAELAVKQAMVFAKEQKWIMAGEPVICLNSVNETELGHQNLMKIVPAPSE